MAKRRGKSSSTNKQDDSWLPLETSPAPSSGFNEYILPGVLFIIITIGGSGLTWVYSEQQQTIESLSETLTSVETRINKLQQQIGDPNAQLASVGGFEKRLLALEEAYASAQRQVELALATSEQIRSKDLHSKVWSLQTEMNSRLAELQQNSISIAALNVVIKNKSIELEVLKQNVNAMLAANSELAFRISGFTDTLSVTKSRLDEEISVVESLMSQLKGQKKDIREMKELITSNQKAFATNAQDLMDFKELLEFEQAKRTQALRNQLNSLHTSMKDFKTGVLNTNLKANLEEVQTQIVPEAQKSTKMEDKVQVDHQLTVDDNDEAPKKKTEHTKEHEFAKEPAARPHKEFAEAGETTEKITTKDEEESNMKDEVVPEYVNVSKQPVVESVAEEMQQDSTEKHKATEEDESNKKHGAREKDKTPVKHVKTEVEETPEKREETEEEMSKKRGEAMEDGTEKFGEPEEVSTEKLGEPEEGSTEKHGETEKEISKKSGEIVEDGTENHGETEEEVPTEKHGATAEEESTEKFEETEEQIKMKHGQLVEDGIEKHGETEEESAEKHGATLEEESTEKHETTEEGSEKDGENGGKIPEKHGPIKEEECTDKQEAAKNEERSEKDGETEEEESQEEHGVAGAKETVNKHKVKREKDVSKIHRAKQNKELHARGEKHSTEELAVVPDVTEKLVEEQVSQTIQTFSEDNTLDDGAQRQKEVDVTENMHKLFEKTTVIGAVEEQAELSEDGLTSLEHSNIASTEIDDAEKQLKPSITGTLKTGPVTNVAEEANIEEQLTENIAEDLQSPLDQIFIEEKESEDDGDLDQE